MRRICMLGLLAACLPPAGDLGSGSPASTAALDTGSGGPTTQATASTGMSTSTSTEPTTSPLTTTGSSGTVLTGSTFLGGPDEEPVQCDVYAQDCPMGQKCSWTATNDASFWEYTTCVPLARDPLPDGAPCTYHLDPLFDGLDECGPAAMCVEAYSTPGQWDGQATCVSLCRGSGEHPYCEPGAVCIVTRTLSLCTPMCDPFVQDCPSEMRCDLYGPAPICLSDWPDGPQLGVGEVCGFQGECALGLTCIEGATPDCESTCCTPFCDRTDPQAVCPVAGQQCLVPYEGLGEQPGAEAVGVCRVEGP